MITEQRLTIRDAEIAVSQNGTGTDLVLMHGFQNDHTAWHPFVERLDLVRFRVTTFDLLGCGASGGYVVGAVHHRRVRRRPRRDLRRAGLGRPGRHRPQPRRGDGAAGRGSAGPIACGGSCWSRRPPPRASTSCPTTPPSRCSRTRRPSSSASWRSPPSATGHPTTTSMRCSPSSPGPCRAHRGRRSLDAQVRAPGSPRGRWPCRRCWCAACVPARAAAQPPRHPAGHPSCGLQVWTTSATSRSSRWPTTSPPSSADRGRPQLTPARPMARPLRKIVTGPLSLTTAIVVDGWS